MAFKNIKSLFIVEDETKKTEEKQEEKKTVEQNSTQNNTKTTENTDGDSKISWKTTTGTSVSGNLSSSTEQVAGEFNQHIFDSLTKAIADSNLPGEDYLEYMQALKAMKDLPLDESIKIQTVLATLSTKGLTVQRVLETADYYLNVLESEKKKFYSVLDNQAKGAINAKKGKILELEKLNKDKAAQIAALTNEINQIHKEVESINAEIDDSENKIKKTESSFLFTFDKVADQIKQDVTKINNLKK
jgi:peptidoglycan hydrolase CwlO-like protein